MKALKKTAVPHAHLLLPVQLKLQVATDQLEIVMRSGVYPLLLTAAVKTLVSGPAIDVDRLIDEALPNKPALQALLYETAAQAARILSAKTLFDPILKIELCNVPMSNFDLIVRP